MMDRVEYGYNLRRRAERAELRAFFRAIAVAGAEARLQQLYGRKFSDRCYHALYDRANKAEQRVAELGAWQATARELLRGWVTAHDNSEMLETQDVCDDSRAFLDGPSDEEPQP